MQDLRNAIELAKSGHKEEARALLLQVLAEDIDNEVAFFWYVDTLSTFAEKIRTLEGFVTRNPGHEHALKALKAMREQAQGRSRERQEVSEEAGEPSSGRMQETGDIVTEFPSRGEPAEPAQTGAEVATGTTAPVEDAGIDAGTEGASIKARTDGAVPEAAERHPSSKVDSLTQLPEPLRRRATRVPAKEKKREKTHSFSSIVAITLIVLAVVACCVVAAYRILDNPMFKTDEQNYAEGMEPIAVKIDIWINGPISEWTTTMEEEVYEGQTYKEVFQLNQMMGYSDFVITEKLSPIASMISWKGLEIYNLLEAKTPPPAIEVAHNRVLACVDYEVKWADAIIAFLEKNEPIDVDDDPCGDFLVAFNEVVVFMSRDR